MGKHCRAGFKMDDSHLNGQDTFWGYGCLKNKTVRTLLRLKTDNILPHLGWVMAILLP